MAFDEQLANSVRKQLGPKAGLVEKKMFGGLAFLINGNMSVGVHGNELIVRIAPESTDTALREPGIPLPSAVNSNVRRQIHTWVARKSVASLHGRS